MDCTEAALFIAEDPLYGPQLFLCDAQGLSPSLFFKKKFSAPSTLHFSRSGYWNGAAGIPPAPPRVTFRHVVTSRSWRCPALPVPRVRQRVTVATRGGSPNRREFPLTSYGQNDDFWAPAGDGCVGKWVGVGFVGPLQKMCLFVGPIESTFKSDR